MRVTLAALADAANLSQEGKLNILGEFDTIYTPSVPTVWPLMVFVAKVKMELGEIEGRHTVSLRVVDQDMQLIAPLISGHVEWADRPAPGTEMAWPLILPIANAQFPDHGVYAFELRIDETLLTSLPLNIRPPATPKV